MLITVYYLILVNLNMFFDMLSYREHTNAFLCIIISIYSYIELIYAKKLDIKKNLKEILITFLINVIISISILSIFAILQMLTVDPRFKILLLKMHIPQILGLVNLKRSPFYRIFITLIETSDLI